MYFFYVLSIVSSAAMISAVDVSFWIMVFSGYVPTSGISGSYGSSIFSLRNLHIMFSVVAESIYIPTNSARGLAFLRTVFSTYGL